MSELKECPFCGANNVGAEYQANSTNQHVLCINCYAQSPAFIDLSKAIKSWSSVTSNAKIQELIDVYSSIHYIPRSGENGGANLLNAMRNDFIAHLNKLIGNNDE